MRLFEAPKGRIGSWAQSAFSGYSITSGRKCTPGRANKKSQRRHYLAILHLASKLGALLCLVWFTCLGFITLVPTIWMQFGLTPSGWVFRLFGKIFSPVLRTRPVELIIRLLPLRNFSTWLQLGYTELELTQIEAGLAFYLLVEGLCYYLYRVRIRELIKHPPRRSNVDQTMMLRLTDHFVADTTSEDIVKFIVYAFYCFSGDENKSSSDPGEDISHPSSVWHGHYLLSKKYGLDFPLLTREDITLYVIENLGLESTHAEKMIRKIENKIGTIFPACHEDDFFLQPTSSLLGKESSSQTTAPSNLNISSWNDSSSSSVAQKDVPPNKSRRPLTPLVTRIRAPHGISFSHNQVHYQHGYHYATNITSDSRRSSKKISFLDSTPDAKGSTTTTSEVSRGLPSSTASGFKLRPVTEHNILEHSASMDAPDSDDHDDKEEQMPVKEHPLHDRGHRDFNSLSSPPKQISDRKFARSSSQSSAFADRAYVYGANGLQPHYRPVIVCLLIHAVHSIVTRLILPILGFVRYRSLRHDLHAVMGFYVLFPSASKKIIVEIKEKADRAREQHELKKRVPCPSDDETHNDKNGDDGGVIHRFRSSSSINDGSDPAATMAPVIRIKPLLMLHGFGFGVIPYITAIGHLFGRYRSQVEIQAGAPGQPYTILYRPLIIPEFRWLGLLPNGGITLRWIVRSLIDFVFENRQRFGQSLSQGLLKLIEDWHLHSLVQALAHRSPFEPNISKAANDSGTSSDGSTEGPKSALNWDETAPHLGKYAHFEQFRKSGIYLPMLPEVVDELVSFVRFISQVMDQPPVVTALSTLTDSDNEMRISLEESDEVPKRTQSLNQVGPWLEDAARPIWSRIFGAAIRPGLRRRTDYATLSYRFFWMPTTTAPKVSPRNSKRSGQVPDFDSSDDQVNTHGSTVKPNLASFDPKAFGPVGFLNPAIDPLEISVARHEFLTRIRLSEDQTSPSSWSGSKTPTIDKSQSTSPILQQQYSASLPTSMHSRPNSRASLTNSLLRGAQSLMGTITPSSLTPSCRPLAAPGTAGTKTTTGHPYKALTGQGVASVEIGCDDSKFSARPPTFLLDPVHEENNSKGECKESLPSTPNEEGNDTASQLINQLTNQIREWFEGPTNEDIHTPTSDGNPWNYSTHNRQMEVHNAPLEFDIWAHSYGTAVASCIAKSYSHSVDRIVLLDPICWIVQLTKKAQLCALPPWKVKLLDRSYGPVSQMHEPPPSDSSQLWPSGLHGSPGRVKSNEAVMLERPTGDQWGQLYSKYGVNAVDLNGKPLEASSLLHRWISVILWLWYSIPTWFAWMVDRALLYIYWYAAYRDFGTRWTTGRQLQGHEYIDNGALTNFAKDGRLLVVLGLRDLIVSSRSVLHHLERGPYEGRPKLIVNDDHHGLCLMRRSVLAEVVLFLDKSLTHDHRVGRTTKDGLDT